MHDVKDIFSRVLDAPAPPMRTSAEIVATARRTVRRRSALTALGSAVAVAATVLTFAVIVGVPAGQRPEPSRTSISGQTAVRLAPMPSLRDIDTHGTQIEAALRSAVPDGLTPGHTEAALIWVMQVPDGAYVTSMRVSMTAISGQGELEVHYCIETTGGGCTAALADRIAAITPDSDVQSIELDGQQIRVAKSTDPSEITATRFLDGGFVTVVSHQGSLPLPPLTLTETAGAAANPALLP